MDNLITWVPTEPTWIQNLYNIEEECKISCSDPDFDLDSLEYIGEEFIPIRKLVSSQKAIDEEQCKQFIKLLHPFAGWSSEAIDDFMERGPLMLDSPFNDTPTVCEDNGKYYVIDGNHRINAYIMDGRDEVECYVIRRKY